MQFALVGDIFGNAESNLGGSAAPYLFFLCFTLAGIGALVIIVALIGNFRNSVFAFLFNVGLVTVVQVPAIVYLFLDDQGDALLAIAGMITWGLGSTALLFGVLNEYRSE